MRRSVQHSTFCCGGAAAITATGGQNSGRIDAVRTARRMHFSPTKMANQMQHPHLFTKTHGYGFIRHDAVFSKDPNAPPAADLAKTPVDRGLGTSAEDPFNRTLPNLELRPPESTVIHRGVADGQPTLDEIQHLANKRDVLGYWLGGVHPRLPLFLRSQKTLPALPVSAATTALLTEFEETILPAKCAETGSQDVSLMVKTWQSCVKRFVTASSSNIFSRDQFESALEAATKNALGMFGPDTVPSDELKAAVEMLRRTAVRDRNGVLEDVAMWLSDSAFLAQGDAVWSVLFDAGRRAMEASRSAADAAPTFLDIPTDATGATKNTSPLAFLWETLVDGASAETRPALLVSAPVALLFFMVANAHAEQSLDGAQHGTLDGGLKARNEPTKNSEDTDASRFGAVPAIERRRFVKDSLEKFAPSELLTDRTAEILRDLGLNDEADAVLGSVAAGKVALDAVSAKALETAALFHDPAQAGFLLYRVGTSTENKALTSRIHEVLSANHFANASSISADPAKWASVHVAVAHALLKDDAFTSVLATTLTAELNAAQQHRSKVKANAIVTEDGKKAVLAIKQIRDAHSNQTAQRTRQLIELLSSNERFTRGIALLQRLGVDMTPLQRWQAQSLEGVTRRERPSVSSDVCAQALSLVARTHPSWIRAGVMPSPSLVKQSCEPSSPDVLRSALRILLRLSYVPHAAAAMMARNTRRRIGPVSTSSVGQNIAIEVGMVEKYDNLQHKRYDWQGWHQRMVDVHNRNVSIRCKLRDLYTLDAHAKPLIDMQGERRLRIVAKDRVGMGIMKLDSDKFEDQDDNFTHGSTKFSQLIADARKTMLGPEYVPTVEVKVRRPSGQSKMHYSALDYDRIERKSAELYAKYQEAKKKSFFVTPMDMWLDVKGLQVRKTAEVADAEGYTVDLFESMAQQQPGEGTGEAS